MSGLAGIGFTVSMFVAGLAFDDAETTDLAKIGELVASLAATPLGSLLLAGYHGSPARAGAVLDAADGPPAVQGRYRPAVETGAAARGPVRVGLVGAGPWAAMVHAPVLARSPHTTLTGVWARRPEAAADLAEQHGTVAEIEVDALLAGCDAVAFAVPPGVQAELAVAAAEAGKAVLLEKPIAADLGGAERLADAVHRAGVASTVVLTWRYASAVRDFLAAAPGIAPRTGVGRFISGGLLGGPFATPWRLERGPLLDLGPHVIDLLDAALGPVTAVSAGGDLHGMVELTLDHAGGATSQAQLCATAVDTRIRASGAEIEGDGGRLEVDCAAAIEPATFSTLAEDFATAVHGSPSPHAPDVQRGLHLQRILDDAEGQLR